jgi:hypothetical protein
MVLNPHFGVLKYETEPRIKFLGHFGVRKFSLLHDILDYIFFVSTYK